MARYASTTTSCLFRNDLRIHGWTGADKVEPAKTWEFGLPRCVWFRARFVVQSVLDLWRNLRSRGSDLERNVVVDSVYASQEYTYGELRTERVRAKHKPLKLYHAHTLVHPDDLLFDFPAEVPDTYTPFRKRVETTPEMVRKEVDMSFSWPGFPEYVHEFEAPVRLVDDMCDDIIWQSKQGKRFAVDQNSAFPFNGGETAALERLNDYLFNMGTIQWYKETRNGMIGTDYSTKFSTSLSHGCFSPHRIWWECRRYEQQIMHGQGNESTWL